MHVTSGYKNRQYPSAKTMQELSPPRSVDESEEIAETVSDRDDESEASTYDSMYDMLIQDLLEFRDTMPLRQQMRMMQFLGGRGHTGLLLFRETAGPPSSPTHAVGSRANSNGVVTPAMSTGNSPLR